MSLPTEIWTYVLFDEEYGWNDDYLRYDRTGVITFGYSTNPDLNNLQYGDLRMILIDKSSGPEAVADAHANELVLFSQRHHFPRLRMYKQPDLSMLRGFAHLETLAKIKASESGRETRVLNALDIALHNLLASKFLAKFKCRQCKRLFQTKFKLRQHIRQAHSLKTHFPVRSEHRRRRPPTPVVISELDEMLSGLQMECESTPTLEELLSGLHLGSESMDVDDEKNEEMEQ